MRSDMKKFRIEDMTRGWFIGDFEPASFKTKNFEVGKGHHKKGEMWDKHYHKLATEITLILKGKVEINDEIFVQGDIFIIEKNEVVEPLFLEETEYVVVKTISDKDDKYIVE
jgi:quercetin dioxygenase-like cupin family protein